jgi:hypothetical protein
MSRLVAVLVALGIARLLPEHGLGLYLRLAAATLALLWPFAGAGAAEALAWSLGTLFLALAVTFAVHGSLTLALVLYALIAAAYALLSHHITMVTQWKREGSRAVGVMLLEAGRRRPVSKLVLLAGLAFGIALWHLAGHVQGDALFHLGRVRKLDDFGSLSLHSVDEFRDGGLHPGYAFPLWHGFLALVARLAGVDPIAAVGHESSLLCPTLFLVAYEAGRELFRSAWLGWATLAAQLGLAALAAGNGGAAPAIALPASAAQFLLAPAVFALVFRCVDRPSARSYAALASASLALALTHPTYALFVLIPLGGFLVARALLAGRDLRELAAALVAAGVPTAAVLLWLLPLVHQSARDVHGIQHGIERYRNQFDVFSANSFRLAPGLIDRRGAVAVAALALVPLAGLARRTRWAAFVLGGSVSLLALALWPLLFVRFAHLVSISQARRAVGFLPLPFALAGGAAVLARLVGPLVLPLGLGAGIWLQRAYPGDFGYVFGGGGPAWATWIALIGGSAAIAGGAIVRRPDRLERRGPVAGLAALLFVLPVAIHGFSRWTPPAGGEQELSAGLVRALRERVPERAVVFSDPETSYRIAAYAPVYVASAPPAHVADTRANRPYAREAEALRFLRTGDLAIARRSGAGWIVLDRRRTKLKLRLPRLYADARYSLYRL